MTARLVALMAFVLFLCLGAFSLLLRASRETVVAEAQETLRTASMKTIEAFGTANLGMVVKGGADNSPLLDVPYFAGAAPCVVQDEKRLRIQTAYRDAVANVSTVDKEVTLPPNLECAQVVVMGLEHKAGASFTGTPIDHGAALPPGEIAKALAGGARPDAMTRARVWVSKGPIEGKPSDGYEFTLALSKGVGGEAKAMALVQDELDIVMKGGEDKPSGPGEFVQFYVPSGVDTVFEAAQQRSLWWFVGVLVLGIALSAGLARRFTRPIRDLDGALRRLSNGDLDVTVDVTSKHEVGRLQSAFNAMATRLKQSRELEKDLHRREKLTALGRLAAGVAHDVRNPLHSIQLTLDHLTDTVHPAAEESAREFDRGVRLIRGEIDRLDRLVEDFLCFARSDPRRTERVDVAVLLTDVAQFVAKEAQRRGLALAIDAAPGLTLQDANPESLRSALLNLVLNGFEAMDTGGTLTLRAFAAADGVALEVEDTGRGIAHEDRERVFEFGFTTRTDGHGLGLAMVHQIVVEEHGGRVQLDSTQGVGTRVRIELPARASQPASHVAQEVA